MSFPLANTRASIPLAAIVLVIAATLPLQSQHKSYLPVLQATDAGDLGIALVNPTIAEATVTLTARSYGGALIQKDGVANPVTLSLPASSQKALQGVEIFGNGISGQTGWVELSASTPAVKGLFMIYDSGLSYMDGSEISTKPSRRLIFPRVSSSSPARVTIVNTAQDVVQGSISVYEDGGGLVGTAVLTLPALGGFTGTVNELVPSSAGFEGYLVVESQTGLGSEGPESLLGFETYRNRSDIALIRAFPQAARQRTAQVAHFVSGGGYSTTLTLLNDRAFPQAIRITAQLEDSSQLFGPKVVGVKRIIPPNGRLHEPVEQMFGLQGNVLTTGYIRYETQGDTPGVFGYLDYGTTDGIALSAVESQGQGYSDVFFSFLAEGSAYYTGVALLNLNTQTATVTMEMFDRTGGRTGSTIFRLAAGERRTKLLSEFFHSAVDQVGGYIRITSTLPIFALELFGSRTTSSFLADVSAQGVNLIPQASGSMVSASAGAQVISQDGTASILIPPNALSADTPIRVVHSGIAGIQRPSTNQWPVSVVDTAPVGTRLQIPVRLTFSLDEQVPPGMRIPLWAFNRQTNQYETTKFFAAADESGRIASAEVSFLTTFVVSLFDDRPLTVSSLEPSSGNALTVVIIRGDGFSASAAENVVTFAGPNNTTVPAQVLTATSTSIYVVVPPGAVTGPIIVQVGFKRSTGFTFTVLTNPPPSSPPPSNPPPSNRPPVVNAGPDQTITLPAVATLSGTAADDGLPLGSTLMVTWAEVSGPDAVTFANANALSTTASFSSDGSYVLRLTATDGALSTTSDITIVVNPPPRGLPGLTDFVTHAPPTSGTYAYNTFKPGAPGFPSAGQSYVDPVFGATITRLSNVGGANEGDFSLYVKNGFWNANGAYHTFRNTATGTADVINASTGAIVRSDTGFTFDSSFDPVDPDILWKWSGADLRKYSISTGVETTEKTFPAPLQTLGGSTDWISADGQYFLLAWNGALHIWRRSDDRTYSGSIIHSVGSGWAGITPDGNYVVVVDDPNSFRYSYAINHNASTLSSSGVMFWNASLDDDHSDLVSASDGKNYAISVNAYDGYIYAVDIAQNMSGKTPAQQAAANRLLIQTDRNVLGDYHFSCVARGQLRDWCVASTISIDDAFDSSPVWYPFKSEIFGVNVLTGAVKRYAHHRSRSVTLANFDRFPRADVDWDGTGIIFSSNYDFPGSNTDYSDLYRIR